MTAADIFAATGLPNTGVKLRRPVVPDDVRFSLGHGERLKKYAGGYDLDELNPFNSKLIKFLKGFVHCNGHPNDKKYQLFHLHMTNHFRSEGEGFIPFDFCDWISQDFTDSMQKVRNGIRYDPSHGAIVFMIFIDAFNTRARNIRGLVPPHEFSEGGSNDEDDDSDGSDEGGDGGEGSSQGIQPQRSAPRGRRAPTDRSAIPLGFGTGPGPSIRPRTLNLWQPDYPLPQQEVQDYAWVPARNSTGLFDFDCEAYMQQAARGPDTVRGPSHRYSNVHPIQNDPEPQSQFTHTPGRFSSAPSAHHSSHKGFLKSLRQKLHL